MQPAQAAAGFGSAASLGLPAAIVVLVAMDSGIPIPIPTDLLLLVLGERAASGAFSPWLAVIGLELVAVLGPTILFLAARGPAAALIARLGPRIGLTEARLASGGNLLRKGGRASLAIGRSTPGLRAATVVAAATARLPAAYALPPLILGSTVFLQTHLALGFWFGPYIRHSLERANLSVILPVFALAVIGLAIWISRRRSAGVQAWTEACCPACLAVALTQRPDAGVKA